LNEAPARAASFGRRLGSLCYEALLLIAILFLAGWLYLAIKPFLPSAVEHLIFQVYLAAVCGIYFVYCWSHSGQTLPMKTWRIRVVTRQGAAVSTQKAALRFALSLLSVALAGGGFLWAFFDRDGQFLHDRLAATRLVEA
jgi:uncharacterized RDD family membrane protein YckC